jgi:DNA-binding NtrC family response regulator
VRQATILVADADATRRGTVREAIAAAGCSLREVSTPNEAASVCRTAEPSAVLFGCDGRGAEGVFAAVAAVRRLAPHLPILLIVENGSEALAVAALRAGVTDYLRHPIDGRELTASLARSGAPQRASAPPASSPPVLIGSSAAMRQVQTYLDQAAQGDANVLITGETGTGKELAAAYLHERSARRAGRFVTVNCAAIPDSLLESELFGHEKGAFTGASASRPGLLEAADRGTIFLDEVGDMGLPAQAKILRAIESREVYRVGGRHRVPLDVRVVTATNQDLEQAGETGRFRQDL